MEPAPGRPYADLFVHRGSLKAVETQLHLAGIRHEVLIQDVGALVDRERSSMVSSLSSGRNYDPEWLRLPVGEDPFLKEYHTLEELQAFMDVLVEKYGGDLVRPVTIGRSYEEREIRGLVVGSSKSANGAKKPQIVFHGGHHAREWIGPAVMVYLLRTFVGEYGQNEDITRLLDTYDFTVVPVLNGKSLFLAIVLIH